MDVDSGEVVGTHEGIHQWTVGQRCRLSSFLQPYFVARKDAASNTIYVAAGHEHPALHSTRIHIGDINWLSKRAHKELTKQGSLRCRFRFQHTKPLVDCQLHSGEVQLDAPLRAITPGQYAVFYDNIACLGSARILHGEPLKEMKQQVALKR